MESFKSDEEKVKDFIAKGLDYADKNEHEKAIKEFENALKISPRDEDTMFNLGLVYIDEKEYGFAYDIFKKIININPHHIEAFNNLGLVFARKGKYSDAVFVYEKGIEYNPDAAILYNNLGNVCYDSGNFEKALAMFKKACELDSVYTERLHHLGIDSYIKDSGESRNDAIAKLEAAAGSGANKAKTMHDTGIAYLER
ncbi:MAG: tetratricopeptide repeat protein [Spirochaetia bacterium]|nr:tetratricopeptide repeat protein [Spirochaetia bacterium]